MGKFVNLTGQRFEKWTVVKQTGKDKWGQILWLCRCMCGKEKEINGNNLRRGETKSCGCLHKGIVTKHGYSNSTEYKSWQMMIQRCNNKNYPEYRNYGGRGIKVCGRWNNAKTGFINFINDMGKCPPGMSIDRIDNNGNYEPKNCRWCSSKEQARNRRTNHKEIFKGNTKLLVEWAEEYNMSYTTLSSRIQRGASIEEALTTPVKKRRKKNK